MTKVLVFGTFDGIHKGHRNFLSDARTYADQLVVAVAVDEVVRQLKGRWPDNNLATRMTALEQLPEISEVVAGDSRLGEYKCLKFAQPDLIAFGYDQTELIQDFKRFQQATSDETPTIVLKPYQPQVYKSSLLRQQS